jgi:phage host-nuclease inhibitor protein Gam
MAKRVKKTVLSGITREQADVAFADFATADAREQKLTASMDEQITKIREKYQDQLQECADNKAKAFDVIQTYATENKEQLFSKKRSLETTHGVFGFRMGTPKLKTKKGFTWAAVVQLLKVYLPDYVRVAEEPAKNLLLDARDDEEVAKHFSDVGLYVDQDESFFVECKKEEALS